MSLLTNKQLDKEIFEKQSFINKIKLKIISYRINKIYNKLISKEKITREDIQCKSI
jgi:hypothetical protein